MTDFLNPLKDIPEEKITALKLYFAALKDNCSSEEKALEEFRHFLRGSSGGFTTSLIKTIMKADYNNKFKLAAGFGWMTYVVYQYQNDMQYVMEKKLDMLGSGIDVP